MSIINVDKIGPVGGGNTITVAAGIASYTGKINCPEFDNNPSFTGNVTIAGNLGVAGTITYEDVDRVDATGISTFREGFGVGPLTGIALTAYKDGSIRSSGIITASSFSGSGTNLTSIPSAQLTGALPAISGASLTGINTAFGSGTSVNTSGIITATAFIPSQGQLSHRNLVINGSMQINQRGSTAGLTDFNVVTGTLYTLDRWEGVGTSSFDWDSARIKQVSDSPDEFSNSLRVDIGNTETPSGGQNGLVRTKLEAQDLQHLAYGTSSAKTCTLSFWVRSNKTGTYCCQIQHRDDDKYLLYEYAISSSNTWEKKTITFAGNTSGAITNDNGTGLVLDFHLACGPDDHVAATSSWTANNSGKLQATSNQVNLWDNTANVWYLTGVQLEVGSVATPFEHRSYGDELQRCLRYCQRYQGGNGSRVAIGVIGDSTTGYASFPTKVPMRATPSISVREAGKIVKEGTAWYDLTSLTIGTCTNDVAVLTCVVSGGHSMSALDPFTMGDYTDFTLNAEL